MARPRAAGYDDQRELILARAAKLFASRGYTATTMNQVAAACGLTKPSLYHYFADKRSLLEHIARGHVARLEDLAAQVRGEGLPPEAHLRRLIERFMAVYAHAQHEHRVLTEDVRFLDAAEREAVLAVERRVVSAFSQAVQAARPALAADELGKPLAMLLFGMMNWTFTWLRPGGALSYEALGRVVADLFCGGLPHVRDLPLRAPRRKAQPSVAASGR